MTTSQNQPEGRCLRLFLFIVLMAGISLSQWAVLIHFNLIGWGWSHWRGAVIVAAIYLPLLYKQAKQDEERLLGIVLLGMVVPWILGAVIVTGFIFINWHVTDFNQLNFSQFGLVQIMCNVLAAVIAAKFKLRDY
jgi:hypothetical protein